MHRIAPLTELWALITACPVGVRHSALPSGCILRPSETRCSLHVSDWLIVLMKLFYLRPSLQAPLPYNVAFLPTALAAWTLSQQVMWNRIYRQIQLWCNMIYIRGFKHAARDALWNFQITVLTIKLSYLGNKSPRVTQLNLLAKCFTRKSISRYLTFFSPVNCKRKLTDEMRN